MDQTLQTEFKNNLVKDLQEKAFREYANAAFDESRIPDVEKLITASEERLHAAEEEHSKLTADPEAHKKQTRSRIKELEGKISEEHEYIKEVRRSIDMIKRSATDQRAKASAALYRAKWILEHYEFQEVDPEQLVKDVAAGAA